MQTPVVSVQAEPEDAASWAASARRLETSGHDALPTARPPGRHPRPPA